MHLSFGTGFLAGCLRFGVPLKAFALALGGPKGRFGSATTRVPSESGTGQTPTSDGYR